MTTRSLDWEARKNAVAPSSSTHWAVKTVRVSVLSFIRAFTSAPWSSNFLMKSRWSMSPLRTG